MGKYECEMYMLIINYNNNFSVTLNHYIVLSLFSIYLAFEDVFLIIRTKDYL